jgi:hypothetical protein
MGPTPPGTGVMYEHFGATSSNSTSPFSFQPDLVSSDLTLVVPTSTTTAPSFTIFPFTNSGTPMAAIIYRHCCKALQDFEYGCEQQLPLHSLPFATTAHLAAAHNIAAANYNTIFPVHINFVTFQQFHNTKGVAETNEGRPITILPTFCG